MVDEHSSIIQDISKLPHFQHIYLTEVNSYKVFYILHCSINHLFIVLYIYLCKWIFPITCHVITSILAK